MTWGGWSPLSTLHLLQNTFTVSNYLVSNWSYSRLNRTIKKVKKTNKTFTIVIIIVRNHYFTILKLSSFIKGFILYQMKQAALKSGYNFTTYGKFMDTSELKNCKLENPSPLFRPLALYLWGGKRRVWAPCSVTFDTWLVDVKILVGLYIETRHRN